MKVIVLMGGPSAERDVSLSTGKGVVEAVKRLGYDVEGVDYTGDGIKLLKDLEQSKGDVLFNALHGPFGEDGSIQGLLEVLKIPYTHSGISASSVAMSKELSKKIFKANGLPVLEGISTTFEELKEKGSPLPYPFVIKPVSLGSSIGVHLIFSEDDFNKFLSQPWPYGDIMVETYCKGREMHICLLGQNPIGIAETKPNGLFYDYEAKYIRGDTQYLLPPPLEEEAFKHLMALGLQAYNVLECKGIARVEVFYDEGKYFVSEVNTQPGMTPTSIVPKVADHYKKMNYDELVLWALKDASVNR